MGKKLNLNLWIIKREIRGR